MATFFTISGWVSLFLAFLFAAAWTGASHQHARYEDLIDAVPFAILAVIFGEFTIFSVIGMALTRASTPVLSPVTIIKILGSGLIFILLLTFAVSYDIIRTEVRYVHYFRSFLSASEIKKINILHTLTSISMIVSAIFLIQGIMSLV